MLSINELKNKEKERGKKNSSFEQGYFKTNNQGIPPRPDSTKPQSLDFRDRYKKFALNVSKEDITRSETGKDQDFTQNQLSINRDSLFDRPRRVESFDFWQ